MKKYLGSRITLFLAIVAPIMFLVLPSVFAIIIFITVKGFAAAFVAGMCCLCVAVCCVYLVKVSNQLYSWGVLDKDKITVKTLLTKDYSLFYKSCSRIGIASYTHGTILAGFGREVIFIFFSCEPFDENYRKNINLLKPSQTFLKVEFDEDLYDFLISILPAKQALLLKQDYKQFLEK